MNKTQRIVVGIAGVLLLLIYLVPVWRISLEAPQYPEGLGLKVWLHTIGGQEQGDLRKINQLNHYIGMKQIKPEEMVEMTVMPIVLGLLSAFALATALLGRRKMLQWWLGSFVLCGVLGFADFFYWAYDYGHDLDPTAPIKVPGMSYQPPLIGSKQLLNFTAHSWPDIGGVLALVAFGLGVAVLLSGRRRDNERTPRCEVHAGLAAVASTALVLLHVLLLAGCRAEPRPIRSGVDTCAHCRMVISDGRFAAQVVTPTGKIYTFDAVECLAGFMQGQERVTEGSRAFVAAFDHPESFLPVEGAHFVKSGAIKSPMGAGLAAYGEHEAAEAFVKEAREGSVLSWAELLTEAEGSESAHPSGHHAAGHHGHHHHGSPAHGSHGS